MADSNQNITSSTIDDSAPKKRHSTAANVARGILWTIGVLILLVIIAVAGLTFYLTPSRLSSIANRKASKYLKADVKTSDIHWTLWSSFPWLTVDIDSVSVRSRALDSIPNSFRQNLPADADFLASTRRIKGAVNIIKAIKGDVALRGIEVDNPDVNLVEVNESVANYLIIPPMKKKTEMPEISLDSVRIGQPMTISYRNIQQEMAVKAVVDKFAISGHPTANSTRHALIAAAVSASTPAYSTETPIPVRLEGDVAFSDDFKKIDLHNLKVNAADINSLITADLSMKDNTIYPLSLNVNVPDVMMFLPFIPHNILPEQLKDVKGYLPLNLKADLLAPFTIGANNSIPSFSAKVATDGGELSYPLSKTQNLVLSGLGLDADAVIDASDPAGSHINLSDLRMESDGTSLHISGRLSEALSGNPDIALDLQCAADLQKALKRMLPSSSLKVSGDLSGKSSLSCKLADLSKKQLKDLHLDGDFQVAALVLNDAASHLSAKLSDFSLKIAADAPELSPASVSDAKLNLLTYIGHSDILYPAASLTASTDKTTLNGDFGAKGSMSSPVAAGKIDFSSGSLNVKQGSDAYSVNDLNVGLDGKLRQIPYSPSVFYPTTPTSRGDSAVAADAKHTPLYLVPSVPPMLQSILSLLDLNVKVAAADGAIKTIAYPADNSFSDMRLATNLDTLLLSSVRLKTRGASGFVSAKVDGLRGFLASSSAVPLKVRLDADLNDVNINQLAGNYFRGVELLTGKPAQLIPPAPGPYTAADSLCIAIPRNISLDARLSSSSAEYMQYSFSPLSTRILMADGDATIKNLSIGTQFCSDNIDWTYSTSNLDSIGMAIKADISDFNLSRFCDSFPELAENAPQLKNLSMDVDLNVAGNFLMGPDMFLDAPSMEGDVNVAVNDFSFVRDKEALKYTHLMLIRGDGPINIDSLNVHAAFHDNLLQLDPFTIDGGGYKLLIGGVNNLRGQMYYHIGLLHNPLHLPFGVNLVGYFRHPQFRFGGRWIKDGRERKIAAELGSDVNVNIMRNLSHGWLLFVGNAAKYDFKNN